MMRATESLSQERLEFYVAEDIALKERLAEVEEELKQRFPKYQSCHIIACKDPARLAAPLSRNDLYSPDGREGHPQNSENPRVRKDQGLRSLYPPFTGIYSPFTAIR
jgi:hypothetical protein